MKMNAAIAIVFWMIISSLFFSLFYKCYKLGMGEVSLKRYFCKKDKYILGGFAIVLFLMFVYLVSKNNYVYYWDYGGYWTMSYTQMKDMFDDPFYGIGHLYYSICMDDYNLLLPTLIYVPLKVFGYSFNRYVLVNVIFLLFPALIICLACNVKLFYKYGLLQEKQKLLSKICLLIFTMTFNVFYLAMLKGYIDIATLIPAGLAFLLFIDYEPTVINKNQIVRDILISLSLLCTFLFRRYFAYFIVGYVAALFLYSCYKILKSNKRKDAIKCSCINIIIIGSLAVVIMVTIFLPLLLHVLKNNYSQQYAAYDAPLLTKLNGIVNTYGIWILFISAIGVILSIVKKNMQKISLFCLIAILVTIGLFFKVQAMGIQHVYTIAIGLYILFFNGIYQIIYSLKNKRIQICAVVIFIGVSVLGTMNCFIPSERQKVAKISKLFTETYDPFYRGDIEQLHQLADYLNSLTYGTEKRVYIDASGGILNNSIMDSLNKPYGTCAVNNLCATADVDLRDGFPKDFLSADIVVVTDPIQLHLAEGTQEVVRFLAQEVCNKESPIGRHFEKNDKYFILDDDVKVFIYEKNSDFEKNDLEYLSNYYSEYYPGQEELFKNRILAQ